MAASRRIHMLLFLKRFGAVRNEARKKAKEEDVGRTEAVKENVGSG